MTIDRIIVIGAGTMGSGIAETGVIAGCAVTLHDADRVQLDRAAAGIAKRLARAVDKQKLNQEQADAALARLSCVASFDELSLADAPLVIEAVVEQTDLKKELLARIDERLSDDAVLASNTSTISITELAAATRRPERVIGMHFFNPVPVMTLVEVIEGLRTDANTIATTEALAQQMGKTPLRVKDRPGFVSNRVLMPMINEAIFCLSEGIADAETIDGIMKLGCNHPMGPLALADLIGLDVCLHILEVLHRDLGDPKFRPCPLLRTLVHAGRLGRKTGQGVHTYDS